MVDFIVHTFRANPELGIFLAIALGTWLGNWRIGKFHLGSVAGSLLMGLFIGQAGIEVPNLLKAVFFALFIYSVGFKSGPEFFGSLNRGTLKLVAFSAVLCVTGLLTILLMNHWFGFDAGFASGLGAGALTDTAMMGTAASALNALPISPAQLNELNSHMAVAYAITYLFGTIGLILFVSTVAPLLLGIDLKQSARELEAQLAEGDARPEEGMSPYTRIVTRAHIVISNGVASGRTIADVEQALPWLGIERVIRLNEVLERRSDLPLLEGDILGIGCQRVYAAQLAALIGPEIDHPEAMSYPTRAVEVVLRRGEFANVSLAEIRKRVGPTSRHGLFLNRVTRQGYDLPLLNQTVFRPGDVAYLSGRPDCVDALAARFGKVRLARHKSDIALHTLGIVLGSLLGAMSAKVGNIPIELGIGGGILVVALVLGWWHSRHPGFGALPPAAQWAFSEFGLTAFAAVVGLLAGPPAIGAIQTHGVSLIIAGVVVTLVPPVVAFYFGKLVLRLHPMILLGALAGAQTEAASMNAIIDQSESQTPVIGFTVCYAISNVLFAVWGPIIVAAA